MKQHDQAQSMLRKARQDLYALQRLIDDPAMADEILGFHAQQAVEKALKAVLTIQAQIYPYTHDLLALIDLLRPANIKFPVEPEQLLRLMPYAVAFRYGQPDQPPLNRIQCNQIAIAVVEWAATLIT